ncbi:MAG TPA: acetyl-CoA carboxylase biotin carboxylase subunit [Magnetospirillaceae bacterium]|nr:acetyl-CoA carboxylase biotin carboxylase subunit [Magnetospirillaceae bacterium]
MKTLLVANRGEIALRVMRTAKRLGLSTVAVYSEADAQAAHVAFADQSFCIGGAAARDSYLKADVILEGAKQAGADAIHPGYGFLSENAEFAEACAAAGITFVGPPPSAIRAMGSKSAAKALMEKAGVPLVPGYHGEDQSFETLAAAAERIGYPLLIKASAGGGGKGMKIVNGQAEFADALASAQREAQNAFKDASVLLEKYLTKPRHIEMQVFADTQGNYVHLFERDCSIQRRYQKVVEEAPAPGFPEARRAAMAEAALGAAKAVAYVGAGTVEFISEGEQFYFMEMNTRLQVEHPVTEAITGQDLVEWQIRVARGEALPLKQDQIKATGHAVEVRLYAEDPERDFLPQIGKLTHLHWPEGVRVDSGVRQGDTVSMHYDPMLAKVIAYGADRAEAIGKLHRALGGTEVTGVATNRRFLRSIVGHPAFAAGEVDTGFIPRHAADLKAPVPDRALMTALATLAVLRKAERDAEQTVDTVDPWSPWGRSPGWRLNRDAYVDVALDEIKVRAHYQAGGFVLDLPEGGSVTVSGTCGEDGSVAARLDRRSLSARAVFGDRMLTLFALGEEAVFTLPDPLAMGGTEAAAGKMVSPMPGQVTKLFVTVGQAVEKGAPLIVIEAMKMEHTITAPKKGKVAKLPYAVGDLVPDAAELLVLDDE